MPPPTDLSRRQFLARSAGLAGASIGLGVCARDLARGAAPGSQIGVGFIGVGDRGNQLLAAALKLPGVRVAALADVDPAHLRRAGDLAREHRPRLAAEAGALLELKEVEAVVIASPVFLHRRHALEALAAGKHVYLEKPMALNVADCLEVRRAAEAGEARGQVFQIGLQRRYSPRYNASLAAIQEGQAGRVLFVRAQWHSTGSPARGNKPWYFRREKSGDIVVEQACHQMDVFNWVFGAEPVQACGLGGTHHSAGGALGRDIRDHYGLVLEYPGGGKVHYSHLTYAIPDRRFAGVYELVLGEKLGIDLANAVAWDRAGKTVELCTASGNDTVLAMEGFFRSIREGTRPAAGAEAGCRATIASLLALEALDSGRTVTWREIAG